MSLLQHTGIGIFVHIDSYSLLSQKEAKRVRAFQGADINEILTFHEGCRPPGADGPAAAVLAKAQLQEEQGQASKQKHHNVGDEESTCKDRKNGEGTL